MTNLDAAKAFLNFYPHARLFPSRWNGKTHAPCIAWAAGASSSPEQIDAWASYWPDAYFCVAAQQSNITILDIDNKHGKDGSANLAALEIQHDNLPDTFTVRTPSGGEHYLFLGKSANSVDKLATGIDTPVMAPVPGTTVPGKGEYKIITNGKLAATPSWIIAKAGEYKERDPEAHVPACDLDLEHNIARAARYAQQAEPSLQGAGGNNHAFQVACRMRDFGVSQNVCAQLLLEHWYPRCQPNNKPEFVERMARNAYRYAQDKAGNDTPDALFGAMQSGFGFKPMHELCNNLKPPRWIIKRYIEEETTTQWFGDQANLKSFLALDLGVAIATGQEWAGEKTAQGPVVYLCGEGHGGIARRLEACRQQREISRTADVPFFVSDLPAMLTDSAGVQQLLASLKALRESVGQPIRLLIVDTLAANFGPADENSSKDMNAFVVALTAIRKTLGCSVLVIHHSGHGAKDRGRGSSVLDRGIDSYSRVERKGGDTVVLRAPGKMKDGEPFRDVWFKAHVRTTGEDEDGNPVTSLSVEHLPDFEGEPEKAKAVKLNGWQGLIRDLIVASERLPIESVRLDYKAAKEDAGAKYDKANFRRDVKKLVDSNILIQEGEVLIDPAAVERAADELSSGPGEVPGS